RITVPTISDSRMDHIEDNLSTSIAQIWGLTTARRRSPQNREAIARILLCFLFMSESLVVAKQTDPRALRRRREIFVPMKVLRELVRETGQTPFFERLQFWLGEMDKRTSQV
ncbi:hypothetical protein AB4144_15790, partial [Rhizobiaceae sp. 2RAB30]